MFLVVEGRLEIDLTDDRTLVLEPWQAVVIPAATVHRTRAISRTVNLTFEALGADTVFVDWVDRDATRRRLFDRLAKHDQRPSAA